MVLGNPPYSGHSANKGPWISGLLRGRLPDGTAASSYYEVDRPLGERNPKWLQDDYVKFIRFGQWRIDRTGYGILAFVTNHGYLDNPTFRGMRQSLALSFSEMAVLDLHGNSKKKEKSPDGSKDENVFDIQQGTAIGIFAKEPEKISPARVRHAQLWGVRQTPDGQGGKYGWLQTHDLSSTQWTEAALRPPGYLFSPSGEAMREEYGRYVDLARVFPVSSLGIVTARDNLCVSWTEDEMLRKLTDFASLSEDAARERCDLGGDTRDWKVALAQADVRAHGLEPRLLVRILYRPFDVRHTYYTGQTRGFICMPRREVMRHMLAGNNRGLIATRQTRDQWAVLATNTAIGHKSVAAYDANSLFPLYLYPDSNTNGSLFSNGSSRHVNLSPEFTADMERRLDMRFVPDGKGDLAATFGPEDVFDYIYAVFHSPTYRSRYSEFLRTDFPRVPLTSDPDLFRGLVSLGANSRLCI